MTKQKKTNKKSLVALGLVCLLLCTAAFGTIAWLTSTSELTNQFTVGEINPIDPEKPGPGDEGIPDDPDIDKKLDDNLYEPNWVPDSKLLPDNEIEKDPYVGIGPDSEASYVYIKVTNNMPTKDKVYFAINEGWEAVDGQVATTVDGTTYYVEGLFRYTTILEANAENNVWTDSALFDKVIVDSEAKADDLATEGVAGSIKVQSFVHQAYDGTGTALEVATVDAAVIEAFNAAP